MRIYVRGDTPLSKEEIKDAVGFFAKRLMKDNLLKKIYISISFKKLKTHKAECWYKDTKNIKPNAFNIVVDNTGGKTTQIKSIAHEMVHVKQFAKGELYYYTLPQNNDKVKWMGKPHKARDEGDEYWEQPWEIEAYGREVGLFFLYQKELKRK